MTSANSTREHPSDSRPETRLSLELERSLSAYTSAALAAGVGLLAMTKSAEAKIVYTPAEVGIPVNGGPVPLDLNHDGITDFVFSNRYINTEFSGWYGALYVGAAGNSRNQFWGRGLMSSRGGRRFASALYPGFLVGANNSYFQKSPRAIMALSFVFSRAFTTGGQWLYTQHRYLGLQFTISGQIHYGWARVAVTRAPSTRGIQIVATLTGYAYETIPNKPIITGKTSGPDVITLEPATLGRLGQGAEGISAWRVKK